MINLGNYEISNYALVKEQLEQAVEAAMLKLEAQGDIKPCDGFRMKANAHEGAADGVAIRIDIGAVKK